MRRIVAFLDVDEDTLLSFHPEDGVGVAFEKQMGWVKGSGIKVAEWAISDDDDEHPYARYIRYLFDWTMNHVEDFDKLESPLTYEAWQKVVTVNDSEYSRK